jgi:ABC-type ATPase involved in cell division
VGLLRFEGCAFGRLAPFSVDVEGGEIVVLAADEDDGVDAALAAALGLVRPRRGGVRAFDVDVEHADHDALRVVRSQAAWASPRAPLLANLSVVDNLLVPLAMRSRPEAEARDDVTALLVVLGLAGLAERRPHELTARQHRELVLARALLLPVPLYLLDDPPWTSRLLGRLPALTAAGAAVVVASTSERLTASLQAMTTQTTTQTTTRLRVLRLQPAPADEVA